VEIGGGNKKSFALSQLTSSWSTRHPVTVTVPSRLWGVNLDRWKQSQIAAVWKRKANWCFVPLCR